MQPPPAAGPDGSGATKAKGSPCMAAQASTPNLRTLVHVPQPLPPWPAEQMATARVQGGRRESHECLRSPSIDRMAETFDHSHAHDRPHQQWRIWRLEQGAQPTAAVGGRRRAVQRRRELGLALGACARGWAGLGEVLAPRADAGGVDDARGAAEGDWERGGDMGRGGEAGCPSAQASRANMRRRLSSACQSRVPENKAPVLCGHIPGTLCRLSPRSTCSAAMKLTFDWSAPCIMSTHAPGRA